MLKREEFNIPEIREKAERYYHYLKKYKSASYLSSFIRNYSMIFYGIDFMCKEDKSQNGSKGEKIHYSVFSDVFFDGLTIDEFFKKKVFIYFIKFKDLSIRYSLPDGDIYSNDFHTYTTIPDEKNIIKIVGGLYGSFDNYFQIDEFYYDQNNYIKNENGLIKYDFNKFQLHSCETTKKNSLISRQFAKNYCYCCGDCKREIVIYGYSTYNGKEDALLKKVLPSLADEDVTNFNKSSEREKKQLYINLTEIGFKDLYEQYLGLCNDTYSGKRYFEEYGFNDEFYNDGRDLDDQSQEFWDSQ